MTEPALAHCLEHLESCPHDPSVIAFFDLDRTLIAGYSVSAFAYERVRERSLSTPHMLRQASVFTAFGCGRADYALLLRETLRGLAGTPETEMFAFAKRVFERHLAGRTYREAYDIVQAHKRKGHRVVIVSSATRYQVALVASELGIENICCTELEVVDGCITGTPVMPVCYGEGKRIAGERMADVWGLTLADAYFYTDSEEDLPLLEVVGQPCAVNAKPRLSRIATARGWPQLRFTRPVKPNVGTRLLARFGYS